jgi:hypothetical protein
VSALVRKWLPPFLVQAEAKTLIDRIVLSSRKRWLLPPEPLTLA